MSLSRLVLVAIALVTLVDVSETDAGGRRLFGRRCRHVRSAPHYRMPTHEAVTDTQVCRTAELLNFQVFCLYLAAECSGMNDPLTVFVFADCGLPVDDKGDPCDHDPPDACESAFLRKTKVEGTYVIDKIANEGIGIDLEPKSTTGFQLIDVKYRHEGENMDRFARVYLREKQAIALPISQDKAKEPVLQATVKHHNKKLDVLTVTLQNGTKIRCLSVHQKD